MKGIFIICSVSATMADPEPAQEQRQEHIDAVEQLTKNKVQLNTNEDANEDDFNNGEEDEDANQDATVTFRFV